jgi:hypothetical protein
MRCEEESIKTFSSLGGQLTSLHGIKIQKELLPTFVHECSMKDVLTFYQIFYSFSPVKLSSLFKFNFEIDCKNSKNV